LPGYFDREVYNILDSPSTAAAATVETPTAAVEAAVDEEVHLYDSNRRVGSDDGLFSDCEKEDVLLSAPAKDVPAPVPISGSFFGINFRYVLFVIL